MCFPKHYVIYGYPNNIFVLYSLYFNNMNIIYFSFPVYSLYSIK